MKSATVRDYLDRYNGTAPGYDALRLILAIAIVLWHSVYVCYGRFSPAHDLVWSHPMVMPLLRSVLPMFFFLSGFLVAGSAYRLQDVRPFLLFRVLRILPALLVEVTLCAVILGALVTTLPLGDYFTHPQFFDYFKNIIGIVQFDLPGVFVESRVPTVSVVNINLWTLPSELESYLLLAVLIITTILFDRKLFLNTFLLGSLWFLVMLPLAMNWGDNGTVFIHPRLLIYSFFIGVFCFVFADRIPLNGWLAGLSVLFLGFFWWKYTTFLGVVGACYMTLALGFCNFGSWALYKKADYSYGIYLYGFPIERALFHFIPAIQEWWQLFIIALPVTLLFAMLSWHFVEKPFLGLKKHFLPNKKGGP